MKKRRHEPDLAEAGDRGVELGEVIDFGGGKSCGGSHWRRLWKLRRLGVGDGNGKVEECSSLKRTRGCEIWKFWDVICPKRKFGYFFFVKK